MLELTDEQRQFEATIREFAGRELAPEIPARDREHRPDPELFAKLAALGSLKPSSQPSSGFCAASRQEPSR